MYIEFLIEKFKNNSEKEAIIHNDNTYNYAWLLDRYNYWNSFIKKKSIPPGSIVAIQTDFSPDSVSLFLSLIQAQTILVPLTSSVEDKTSEFLDIAQVEFLIEIGKQDKASFIKLSNQPTHELYYKLREKKQPGLVLFSSGSTGKSKAALHDLSELLNKFKVSRHTFKSITFLLYDHIGGINTMLYILANAGCIVTVPERTPDTVLSIIEKHRVEVLPTSPTFINLILLSETYKKYDLSSLKTVTYGTEPMPQSTLDKFHKIFPKIRLLQTYGLSEVGILRSKSKSSDSLWVKIGGEDFQTRIVDNILQIKSKSSMLGYLNAENPFTEDGWFITGDSVIQDGEYIKILGRKSEIINVGGEKVYPTEVENFLLTMDNIAEVTVYGDKHPITGNIVCAKFRLKDTEEISEFRKRLRKYCSGKIEEYKIPVKISLQDDEQYSKRFKKIRILEKLYENKGFNQ